VEKQKEQKAPLILNGARQVGKTWLLKEFDRTHFANAAYVSLDANKAVRALFDSGFDMKRIINGLSLLSGEQINPGSTLIILKRKKMV
jgi:predicted AAA+ superfamily ATPase